MKRAITTLALTAILGVSAAGAFAHEHSGAAKPRPAKPAKVTSAVCPVMKTKIPDIRKAAGKSTYKGKTYYFCCKSCKPMFDKNPAKYAGK